MALEKADPFSSLTDLDQWQSFEDYLEGCDNQLQSDISKNIELRSELRKVLLADPGFRQRVRRVTPELATWAKDTLFSGEVCAVDGTLSIVPSTSGGRARISVVATSYKSDRIDRVIYVSYGRLSEPVTGPTEYFKKLKTVTSTTNLLMRAVMEYAERDLALRRPEKWKFVHGELLPYELRTGAGRTSTVVPKAIDLGTRLITSETIPV